MRLKYFLSAAMLSALFAACSDDIGNGNNEQPEGEGKSYVNIAINLPTVNGAGTRADGDPDQSNDQFDDGEASEYAVKCAHLVIFKSTTADDESTAVVEWVDEIKGLRPWNLEGTTVDNITTTATAIQEIKLSPADNLWALVVLNDPDAKTHFKRETQFSDLRNKAEKSFEMTKNGALYMSNAPLYKNDKVTTLVKLAKNQMYPTEAEARAGSPIDIFVERGVAKVTITSPSTEQNIIMGSDEYIATIVNWELDITNNWTFLIRNVSEFDKWKNLIAEGATSKGARFYSSTSNRIYWAIDPNYDNDPTNNRLPEDAFFKLSKTDPITKSTTDIAYCRENTFNVRNQRQDRTTRVVFKATFAPKGGEASTFYTIGTSGEIYDKDLMQKAIKEQAIKVLTEKTDASKYTFATETTVSSTAGEHSIEENDIYYDGTALSTEEIGKLNDALGTINTYKDGICYYIARIQHFGETYTPWKSGDPTYGEIDGSTRPKAETNYLGRYGVLRNNWYELAVTGIKGLGDPTIPEGEDIPDDEDKFYLNFKVNIHAWAKRVQNVEL